MRLFRRTVMPATAALLLLAPAAAYADQAVVDGDQVTSSTTLAFGDVCAGETVEREVFLGAQRAGNNNGNNFANGAKLLATAESVPAPLSSTAPDGPQLPGNWLSLNNAVEPSVTHPVVTLAVPLSAATGPQTRDLRYSLRGEDAAAGTFTLYREKTIQATWNVVSCADTTPPEISYTIDPATPTGQNGWWTGDVSVDWTVTDAESTVSSTTGCVDSTLATDGVETYSCTATSTGGTAGPVDVTLMRDTEAPSVTPVVTGVQQNGWYVGDVSLAWQTHDETSQLASTTNCGNVAITEDQTPQTYSCTAVDVAGWTTTVDVEIGRDTLAPVITRTVTGQLGSNDWYVSDVLIDWQVDDATSGVASSDCPEAPLTTDTASHTWTCTATDAAGHTSSDSATVKRDATAPGVQWASGPADASTYDFGDPVPAPACAATDAMSGPDTCAVTGYATTVGTHTLTATAKDLAGNTTTSSATYTVAPWVLDGFYRPVNSDPNVVNTVKAGATVPLKFNVLKGGVPLTQGIGATFSARKVACDGSDLPEAVEEFSTTGSTSLRYDGTAGQWIQNWATPAGGKGSCYRVTLTTADSTSLSARFLLK